MTSPTYVPIAGLRVPAQLVPRIVAAVRGLYPDLTAGKDNDAAIRAWLKLVVTQTLAQWEQQQAQAPVQAAVDATRQEYADKAEAARTKAIEDAATIVEAPPPSPPPTA